MSDWCCGTCRETTNRDVLRSDREKAERRVIEGAKAWHAQWKAGECCLSELFQRVSALLAAEEAERG